MNKIVNTNNDIKILISQMEKMFGSGSVMILGQKSNVNVDCVSTGSLSLDIALGTGGFPRGKIIEIYGHESSGKTTLALHAIHEFQKIGGICAFIDSEHTLDVTYVKDLGIDVDNLILSQPDFGEQALSILETFIKDGNIDIVVIDSVAALVPKAEIDGDLEDQLPGLQARLMSKGLRRLAGIINKSKTAIIFINQLRHKIGAYGNPETTTGGQALKFYSSIRIEVRTGEKITKNDIAFGMRTKIKVVKNKLSPPFKTADVEIVYGKGISYLTEIIELGNKFAIIERNGAWYSYKNEKIGQGIEQVKLFLLKAPEVVKEIHKEIIKRSGLFSH